jgi:hypothetical protein
MIRYHWRVIYREENEYKGVIGTSKYDTWDEANRVACRYNQHFCYHNGHFEVCAFNLKGYML